MAKRKRLNKNLVAFLTIMGIVLAVSVFGLVTKSLAFQDPAAVAELAEQRYEQGDLERAAGEWYRAYTISKGLEGGANSEYLIKSTNCMFEMGELARWLGPLRTGVKANPQDRELTLALIDGLWELYYLTGGRAGWGWENWQEYGSNLAAIPGVSDETRAVGLATAAIGAWELADDKVAADPDALAREAYELAPTLPRPVVAYARLIEREARAEQEGLRARRAGRAEFEAWGAARRERLRAALEPAIAAHPTHGFLAIRYAALLDDPAEQRAVLHAAVETDEPSPDACLALAQEYARAAARIRATLQERLAGSEATAEDAAARDEIAALRAEEVEYTEQADAWALRATELDKAMYGAYAVRARLKLHRSDERGAPVAPQREEYLAALDAYERARVGTLVVENLRAQLTGWLRVDLLQQGFMTALAYYDHAGRARAEDEQQVALELAEPFLDDALTQYPTHPVTPYLQGLYALATGDQIEAINAFDTAHAHAESQVSGLGAELWGYFDIPVLPADRLARLYHERGTLGEAAKWADIALEQYQRLEQAAPVQLLLTRAELYGKLEGDAGAQEALDLLDAYVAEQDPTGDNLERVLAARASVLRMLGREDEARSALGRIERADPGMQIWKAQQAALAEDFEEAERLLRAALEVADLSDEQFRLGLQALVGVLVQTDRRDEAVALIDAYRTANQRPALANLLEGLRLRLSEDDPEKRDAARLAFIEQMEDPYERAQHLFAFYGARRKHAEAAEQLAILRELRPDELRWVETDFRLTLQRAQEARRDDDVQQAEALLEEAAELLVPLSQARDGQGYDQAQGSTYRGVLALARGDADAAIKAFIAARQALPASDELELQLAQAYQLAGRIDEAVAALERAVELNPRSFDAHWRLVGLYDRQADNRVGDARSDALELAEAAFKRARELRPNHPGVRGWEQRSAENQDPVAALEEREARRAEAPDDLDNIVRMAELYGIAVVRVPEGDVADDALAFFDEVVPALEGENRLVLTQEAVDIYAQLARQAALRQDAEALERLRSGGRTLLQQAADGLSEVNVVTARLLEASFLERVGLVEAAEVVYQEAAEAARALSPSEGAERVWRQTGDALIQFYRTRENYGAMADVCRARLDQLDVVGAEDPERERELRLELFNALFSAGDLPAAADVINDVLQRRPDDVAALRSRALLRLAQRNRQAAYEDLSAMLRINPEHVWALFTRGGLGLERRQFDRAREDLERAEKLIDPREQWALLHDVRARLAQLYTSTDAYLRATDKLQANLDLLEAQKEREGQPPAIVAAVTEKQQGTIARLARILYQGMNDFRGAQELIARYLQLHPDEALWPYEMARLFQARAEKRGADDARGREDYSQAAAYYEQAAEIAAQGNPAAALRPTAARLAALGKAGRAREAQAVFEQLDERLKRPELRFEYAVALLKTQQSQAALEEFARVLYQSAAGPGGGVEQTGAMASRLRGVLALEQVEALLRSVMDQTETGTRPSQRIRIVLAAHLAATGEAAQAGELLGGVLGEIERGGFGTGEHLNALLTRAQVEQALGKTAAAVATYKEVLDIFGDQTAALNNLSYLLVTEDAVFAPREAREYAERLREQAASHPNAASILDTVGWVYFKYGQAEESKEYLDLAIAALEEGLSLDEQNLALYRHLGEVYADRGRGTDARRVFENGMRVARELGRDDQVAEFEQRIGGLN